MVGASDRRASATILLAVLLLCLAGCADVALTQKPNEMLVRLGQREELSPAAQHADLFLDYALLADQTYADGLYRKDRGKPYDIGDGTYCLVAVGAGAPCPDGRHLTEYARRRLDRWRRIEADDDFTRFPCPHERPICTQPLGGLGVQVWVRRGRVCSEAVVAFRGTEGGSADDWLSNLRWLLRLVPLYDQYAQVQDQAPGLIDLVKHDPCFRPGHTRIVAVGHSLGGGLAQQAAYRDGGIVHVYAFDPSFVTGYYDLPVAEREANRGGLSMERVFERGEVLSYPRSLLGELYGVSDCDPRIRTIRLYTAAGSAVARHSLNRMATAFLDWSKARHDAGLSANVGLPAPTTRACASKDPAERAPA